MAAPVRARGEVRAMALRDTLLPDFDHEMAVTRRLLERLPDEKFDWRPHEKSFTLGGLATHLAQIPYWGQAILDKEAYDLSDSDKNRAAARRTQAEVLDTFDQHVADVRRRLERQSDAELHAPWALKQRGQVLMSLPRAAAIRSFVMHHMIHHRGQLTVYLRLQGVPLPPIYGPTADEGM
jgi:uncharacterized damage-inducible protein DinB